MSSSALMTIGMRAMFADYASMQTTGHNIANANTPGYSRQTVNLATAGGQFSGAGFFGKGVDVSSVQRASNKFLTMQAQAASSMAAMDDARSSQLLQLQNVFPTGASGVGAAMGDFLNSFVDLATDPDDGSARQVILSDATQVAQRFADAGAQLDALQVGVNGDLKSAVEQVNSLAQQVAKINEQIAGFKGLGQPPNDLLDQRDDLVRQIGSFVKVSTMPANDGSLGVFIAGGQRLVLGNSAQQLAVTQDPADASRSAISISDNGILRPLTPDLLVGGSISGLLKFQNEDLVDARNQLGQQAAAFAWRVNQVQSYGLDMGSPAGSGAPIFGTGAPQAIPNANNARDATGAFASSVSITVTDGTQLQASDYTLAADPANPGSYIVTRQSDGVQFGMAPDASSPGQFQYTRLSDGAALGNSMDGMRLDVTGTPTGTDSFLLQPVGRASAGMKCVLDDPNGIAAAAPVTGLVGAANTGTATITQLDVVSSAYDPNTDTNITFGANGTYTYQLVDYNGNVTGTGSGTWTPGQPIAINGYELSLNGVPASGDTIDVVRTAHPESNNGNAQAMVALRDEQLVGRTQRLDGTIAAGETVTDAYATSLADVGVRVQSAQTSAKISAAASSQADTALGSQTGVNLDEEAARLIQFQQGYQAAAKVLQVAQSIFDTMLQTLAR
jgi:flagellar hook-associated protein 1 FlgK